MTSSAQRLTYTPAEVADLLRVCRATVYNLTASGDLRMIKVGRASRILAADLDAFLASRSTVA